MKKLDYNVTDPVAKENTRKLSEEFEMAPILNADWKLFDVTKEAPGVFTISHGLSFKPLDFIVVHDTAGVYVDQAEINNTTFELDFAQAGRVRLILGRMR